MGGESTQDSAVVSETPSAWYVDGMGLYRPPVSDFAPEEGADADPYAAHWRELDPAEVARVTGWLLCLGGLPLLIFNLSAAWVLGLGAATVGQAAGYRCPRCRVRFSRAIGLVAARACQHCGLARRAGYVATEHRRWSRLGRALAHAQGERASERARRGASPSAQ